jgi:hypothetical protein
MSWTSPVHRDTASADNSADFGSFCLALWYTGVWVISMLYTDSGEASALFVAMIVAGLSEDKITPPESPAASSPSYLLAG